MVLDSSLVSSSALAETLSLLFDGRGSFTMRLSIGLVCQIWLRLGTAFSLSLDLISSGELFLTSPTCEIMLYLDYC